MAKTDRRGRSLRAFLVAEIVGGDVTVEQVREAVGVKRSRWYGERGGPGRVEAEDFPNADELRHVAAYYNLGQEGWLKLLVEFGWLSRTDGQTGYSTGGSVDTGPLVIATRERGGRVRTEVDPDKPPI